MAKSKTLFIIALVFVLFSLVLAQQSKIQQLSQENVQTNVAPEYPEEQAIEVGEKSRLIDEYLYNHTNVLGLIKPEQIGTLITGNFLSHIDNSGTSYLFSVRRSVDAFSLNDIYVASADSLRKIATLSSTCEPLEFKSLVSEDFVPYPVKRVLLTFTCYFEYPGSHEKAALIYDWNSDQIVPNPSLDDETLLANSGSNDLSKSFPGSLVAIFKGVNNSQSRFVLNQTLEVEPNSAQADFSYLIQSYDGNGKALTSLKHP